MILIDQSLGSRDLIRYPPLNDRKIACLTSLSLSQDTKSSCDICFTGNGPDGKVSIGIEFKDLSDLLSSIHNGRLGATQAQAMLSEYDYCYLLYYGEYRCDEDGDLTIPYPFSFLAHDKNKKDPSHKDWYWYVKGVPYHGPYPSKSEAYSAYLNSSLSRRWEKYTLVGGKPMKFGYLEGALLSLSRAGIIPKHFIRIEDCAAWIGVTYRSWSKPWDKHRFFHTFDKSSNGKSPALMPGMDRVTRQILDIAKEFPGMGFERAMAAAQHFNSPCEMFNATIEDWTRIPGIGKVIAKAIVEAIHKSKKGKEKDKDKENKEVSLGKPANDSSVNLDIFR